MSLKASPIAFDAEAHAVATAQFGPRRPHITEILPLAALTISLGIMNGETRLGPRSKSVQCCSSISLRPPIPLPVTTPYRYASPLEKSMPDCLIAFTAPYTANWQKRSSRLTSRTGMQSVGSKSLISPPKRTLNSEQSNRSRRLTPLLPAQSLSQNSEISKPNAVTTDMPVTTTRLVMTLLLLLDVLDGVADSLDFFVIFVGN